MKRVALDVQSLALQEAARGEPEGEEPEEDLNDRLKRLVSSADVMLFMKGSPAAPGLKD